jgi:hypothetical protein
MRIPGFTAESVLSVTGRGYRMPRLPKGRQIAAASGVGLALINNDGGGSNFTCNIDGTCQCIGGSLSADCWLMQPNCINDLQCSAYYPYPCTCNWTLAGLRPWTFQRPSGGVSLPFQKL